MIQNKIPPKPKVMNIATYVRLKPCDKNPTKKSKAALWKNDKNKIITDKGSEAYSFGNLKIFPNNSRPRFWRTRF